MHAFQRKLQCFVCIALALVLWHLCSPVLSLAEVVDVSGQVSVTTANERSTLDRITREVTSVADITILNTSAEQLAVPIRAVFDLSSSQIEMPNALGGIASPPYNTYYFDLSSLAPGNLNPGDSVTFQAIFIRFYSVLFTYSVRVFAEQETGIDQCPEDSDKTAPGICGCGIPDLDSDNDGTFDCNDLCPDDPLKIAPGICGCGVADTDTDNDTIADCQEIEECDGLDNNGDGAIDEGFNIGAACDNGQLGVCRTSGQIVCLDTETTVCSAPDGSGNSISEICNDTLDNDCDGLSDTDDPDCAPVDCVVGPWSEWSSCSVECGGGQQTRTRTIEIAPENGGTQCPVLEENQDCNTQPCDVDQCPEDPNKTEPGICGCGVSDSDSDGNGVPDCLDGNQPPALDIVDDRIVAEGSTLVVAIVATDPENDSITLAAPSLPAFCQFSDTGNGTGTLTFSPGYLDSVSSPYVITVTATDEPGAASAISFSVAVSDVNRPPVLEPVSNQETIEGQQLTFTLTGSDPDNDPLVFSAGNMPPGASLTETGAFSWMPDFDQSGIHTIFMVLSDGEDSVEQQTRITVTDINRSPVIITLAIPPAGINKLYGETIEAADPDGDSLSFSLFEGPPDMSIDSPTGQLAWRPTLADMGEHIVQIQVNDNKGGTDSRQYALAVPDTIPPSVLLNAPAQAIPGSSFTITAQAADNDQVNSVTLEGVGFGSEQFVYPPYELFIQLPELAQVGTSVVFTASAIDPGSNTAEARAVVNIVGSPDVTPPQVTLHAPPQAGQGQTILLTATAHDDAGVATVTFSTGDGTFIGSSRGDNAQVSFTIAADAPLDSVLQFEAVAEDFSGHSGVDQATTLVIGEPDLTSPDLTLEAPDDVEEDEPLIIVVQTEDDTCLVEIFINHILAAVYTGPQNGSLSVPLPPGVESNMEVPVVVVITDCAANTTLQEDVVAVLATGQGLITGEVYNDRTGLPLAQANLFFTTGSDEEVTGQTDQFGRFSLVAGSGAGDLVVSAAGFTSVTRAALLVPDNAGIEVFDARLTPLSAPQPTASAVLGSVLRTPFSLVTAGFIPVLEDKGQDPASLAAADIVVDIPAGSCSADHEFTMTQISGQGLRGLLPGGWSPLGAVDLGPSAVSFSRDAAISIPNSLGISDAQVVILSLWDESTNAWRLVTAATLSQDGSMITGDISVSGQYAFLLADLVPQQPATVQPGELLAGVIPALVPEAANATISPQPQIIFYHPGVYSDVGLNVSTGSPDLSSGTPLIAGISEEYDFYDNSRMTPAAYQQDIIGYSWNRTALTALWPVTPFMEFEALALRQGTISVDVLAPVDAGRQVSVVGPGGGTVSTTAGAVLSLPAGSVAGLVPLRLDSLTANDLAIEVPVDFDFLGGVSIAAADTVFGLPAQLTIPLPDDFVDGGQIVLVNLQEVQGATRPVLVGLGQVQDGTIVSLDELPGGNNRKLPGITSEGRYLFLQTLSPTGFAAGRIYDTSAVPLNGALITAESLSLVSLSEADGSYGALVPVGQFALSGLDLQTMDEGLVPGTIPAAGDLVLLDISLQQEPPWIVSVDPQNGAENVALAAAITIHFSEPLDPATAIPDNVTLTGSQGQISGTISLSSADAVLSFRPTEPLLPDNLYIFTISQGVSDLAGHALDAVFTMGFTSLDTLPPPMPAAGDITAAIPDDTGRTTITATQGTAGPHDIVTIINKTKDTSSPVLVESDGSFSINIDANIIDEVVISITDQAGNEIVVSVGRFENPDGSVVIGPEGGVLWAEGDLSLNIPAGAFPSGAIVRFTPFAEAEIGVSPGPDFPFVAGFEIESSVTPEIYLNVSAPLPTGANLDTMGIVARLDEAYGEPVLAVVDTAKVIDGRLSTSSPPCPGITSRLDRYAMFLNQDQRMAMTQSLISIVATGMHEVTFQAIIEENGDIEPLYPFVAIATGDTGHAIGEMYEQLCLPVPADEPLTVVIRDAETREALDYKEVDPIEPFKFSHFDASIYFGSAGDITPPAIIGINPISRVLGGSNKRIQLRFSEPLDYMALLGVGLQDIYLTAEDGQAIYKGTWQLLENNTLLLFETNTQLPLGKQYRLHLENIKDLAGLSFQGPPIIFSTFSPGILFPTRSNHLYRNEIAGDLNVGAENIPQSLWFTDVDFVTRSPDESFDGKWHTLLATIQGGDIPGGAYSLFTIDLSDPTTPSVTGAFQTDSEFSQARVRLLDNMDIIPREDSWANPAFWKNRLLYYSMKDPSVRICVDPDDANQGRYDQWFASNCIAEDGGCGTISGGCGDLVVTIADSNKYSYLWTYDVTVNDEPKWISSRRLSDNGIAYGNYRQFEAPAGMGTPLGLSVLPGMDITHGNLLHQNTVGAYVANYNIGLELIDLGLNIPTINDFERESSDDYPWAYNETMQLNAQLYYRDVAIVPSRTTADNTIIPPKVVAVAGDLNDAVGVRTMEIFRADLAGEPTGFKPLDRKPSHVAIATDISVWDYDSSQAIYYDLALITTDSGGLYIYDIPEDGSSPQQSGFFLTTPAGVVTRHIVVDSTARLAFVGATNINETTGGDGLLIVDISEPFTYRGDEDGDGWNDRIIGKLPLTLSGYAGPVHLHGFKLDSERGLIYAGIYAGGEQALTVIKVRECSDLLVDFTAVGETAPAPEAAEKEALRQVFDNGLAQSGVANDTIAVLAHGDRACLWKGSCQAGSESSNRRYRFTLIIPQEQWQDRDLLLVKLYEQVVDAEGEAKTIEAFGFQVHFEDIEFLAIQKEQFITAEPDLVPLPEDLGLARQTQLLEWLLRGAYVDGVVELSPDPMPFELLLTLLADDCDENECQEAEPSHIWRQEGYELAKMQEAAFYKSGALIRFHGESEPDSSLYHELQNDLQEVARAAMKATLARIIANEETNLFMAFQVDTYKGYGLGLEVNGSLDLQLWQSTLACTSFEHWVATIAARTVQESLGVFTIEEIVEKIYEFRAITDGKKEITTAEEANSFIAMAYQFINDVTSGFAWSVYQAKLLDDPLRTERITNMAALEAEILQLQQQGSKEIRPRLVNKGSQNVQDIWLRMYDRSNISGNATTEIQTDILAGSEIYSTKKTFVLENILQTDTGLSGWHSFLLDIPDKTVREKERNNNWINLFYYILDPADPSVPVLPPEPALPVDDPDGDLLDSDPACLCKEPELSITMSVAGSRQVELRPGDCVDLDIRVVNIGQESLTDVRLYITLPGMEDWTYDIPEIAAGEEKVVGLQYCVPDDAIDSYDGYVWFEEMDEEFEPPPAVSNPLNIQVVESGFAVDAKANGKDEVFVGKEWDVTFSVTFDQTKCTSPRYFWDLGDAKGLFNDAGGTYAYAKGGTYKAKVRLTCNEGWEEDVVNVHVVEVEILVNNTLDDLQLDGDAGEVDDLVRLKTDLPGGLPTRIFTTPCSIRLKQPLTKSPWVMLMSPNAQVGFAAAGAVDPVAESLLELSLPKTGIPVEFAITGEKGSENNNDAMIRALLEDPGPPLVEEDLAVFWFDDAHIDIEIGGTYSLNPYAEEPGMWHLHPDGTPPPFGGYGVMLQARATLKPDGLDCSAPQISRIRIGIAQNASDWEDVYDYYEPQGFYRDSNAPTVQVPEIMRRTVTWSGIPAGQWLTDSSAEHDPLYNKCVAPEIGSTDCPMSSPYLWNKPPTGCIDPQTGEDASLFIWIDVNFPEYGTWNQDSPLSLVAKKYPPELWGKYAEDSEPPIEAKDLDGVVVADYRYQQMRIFRKENFRCWVVTLDRDGPWESVSYPEEIIPLRENEWVMDIEYDSVSGYPADLLKQRMQNPPGADYLPVHMPVTGRPYPNEQELLWVTGPLGDTKVELTR